MFKVTLFFPGDGVTAKSNSALYKNVTVKPIQNANGTLTFTDTHFGTITHNGVWRIAEGGPDAPAARPAARRPGNGY